MNRDAQFLFARLGYPRLPVAEASSAIPKASSVDEGGPTFGSRPDNREFRHPVVLFANGVGRFETPISDSVLRILVGSTAATVIGLVGMVLTGIFVGARRRS